MKVLCMSEEVDANSDYSDWEVETGRTNEWKEEPEIKESIIHFSIQIRGRHYFIESKGRNTN